MSTAADRKELAGYADQLEAMATYIYDLAERTSDVNDSQAYFAWVDKLTELGEEFKVEAK